MSGSRTDGSSPTGYILLKGGLALPVEMVSLALELEERGVAFTVEDERLVVGGAPLLSAEERVKVRRWGRHLRALVEYCERVQ